MFKRTDDFLGVGINYRSQINESILKHINDIDVIEVYTEKFFIKQHDAIFNNIKEKVPLLLHGLDMSIGSIGEIKQSYLKNLLRVLNNEQYEWYSDHISTTQEDNVETGHLMPVSFTDEMVDNIVAKAKYINKLSKKPFLLENITYYYELPGAKMSEVDFISKIISTTNCGMLLDINNLYINAINHQYDPYDYLEKIPRDAVVEMHLAGGSSKFNMLIDTHANAVSKEVWELFEYASKKIRCNCVIIERDSNLPRFEDILDEVKLAKSILKKNGYYK